MDGSPTISEKILALLKDAGVAHRVVEHAPTRTSEESARARGEPLGTGAKALLLKTDDAFRLFVLPADLQLASAKVKRSLGLQRLRFASPEELLALTGLVPGSVPPFGAPLLPFPLYADNGLGKRFPQIAFNCGLLTRSVVMAAEDWERLAAPERMELAAGDV
jgi:prolyl-tRNA editing enzyme YbaK/EbsC (Cys-tRNA(Pro) deacylase)